MATLIGGEEFQRRMMELADRFRDPKTLRVGFLEGDTYPDGTPVALVAIVQNFGSMSRGIPPRPFLSNVVAGRSSEWPDQLASDLVATNYDVTKSLERLGETITAQITDEIFNGTFTPLDPKTVERKGFDKPLVASGQLSTSPRYEVK